MEKKQYGLVTAITMIVGIVIGSGIFFKSDDILIATGGRIGLGVVVFSLAAISIIFGSLTIAELAARHSQAGGIITYAEHTCNKYVACAFGWFHTFLYYPTLIAVVAWVIGVYTTLLLGIKSSLNLEIAIGLGMICLLFVCNILSTKLGSAFQNLSTFIKLIPLFLIAILGLAYGDPSPVDAQQLTKFQSATWISAIAPIAFAFDGWIIATSIGHEIKDAKRNLPLALVFAPLFILAIYLLYFIGISSFVGPEEVMKLGNDHVYVAAQKLFGDFGGKLMLIFIIISVMGTVNGLIMGLIRLPYALAIRGMFPFSSSIRQVHPRLGISLLSALVAFLLSVFWLGVHFLSQSSGLLGHSDISEISITINYALYMILYLKVFQLGQQGEIKSLWRGKINPILACLGSLMILGGSLSNPMFGYYTSFCLLLLIISCVFWHKKSCEH